MIIIDRLSSIRERDELDQLEAESLKVLTMGTRLCAGVTRIRLGSAKEFAHQRKRLIGQP